MANEFPSQFPPHQEQFSAKISSHNHHVFIENENNIADEEDDNETHLGDVAERCDSDLEELDSYWTDVDNNNADNINIDDDNLLAEDYSSCGPETGGTGLFNFENNQYESLYTDSTDLIKQRVKFCESVNKAEKPYESEMKSEGDMAPLKVPDSLNIFSDGYKQLYYGPENRNEDTMADSAAREGKSLFDQDLVRGFIKVEEFSLKKDLDEL